MANGHGGKRPGAGRKNGSKVKRHRYLDDVPDGVSPIDYLLSIMRDESQSLQTRLNCAKWAAPYLHPRLASQRIHAESDMPVVINLISPKIV